MMTEKHGYYRLTEDNLSKLIDSYTKDDFERFYIFVATQNDVLKVGNTITSLLTQKSLFYKASMDNYGQYIMWSSDKRIKLNACEYESGSFPRKYIKIFSCEMCTSLTLKGQKAWNVVLADKIFENKNNKYLAFLNLISLINTHDFKNFMTSFKK